MLAQLTRQASTGQARKLANRTAIVTGSTDGIGFAIAKRLAQDGANVVVSSRKAQNVEKAVHELKDSFPNQVTGITCHVGNEDDRKRLIEHAMSKFGTIDILVSNVAVNPVFGSFLDTDESSWDKIMDVNVKAPFMLTKLAVPHMLNNKRPGDNGAIVYVSSIGAYIGMNMIGAYSVSKTALLGLCRNAANELGVEGIRVNLVAPGVIKTKFSNVLWENESASDTFKALNCLKRLGESDEIGGAVSFLCGPDSSYITGESLVIAGGHHCHL